MKKSKKMAYLVTFLFMLIFLIIYTFFDKKYLLPDELSNTPQIIGSIGAVVLFCIRIKFDDKQNYNNK